MWKNKGEKSFGRMIRERMWVVNSDWEKQNIWKEMKQAIINKRNSKKNLEESQNSLAITQAQKDYKDEYWENLTPSKIKEELTSMRPSRGVREYWKNKRKYLKEAKNRVKNT